MARFERKKNEGDKVQENGEPEVNEVTIEPTESTETVEAEEDFDSLMASFTNDAVNDAAEEDDTNMVKQGTVNADAEDAEVNDAEDVNTEDVNDPTESALSDAAKEIAERATGHTVEMLPVTSLPPTVPHIMGNLMTLDAISSQIKAGIEEFNAGTAGKDEKVKHAIATLTKDTELNPSELLNLAEKRANGDETVEELSAFAKREAIAAAKARITELEDLIEREETALYESVENALAAAGDVIWSEETIKEKRQYLTDMYAGYLEMHKGTEKWIESHRNLKPADNVGTINQYHNKLDKPFKRSGSASTSTGVRRSSGPRNVSVSDARLSFDGGVTWMRTEGQLQADGPVLSNPQFAAAEIARVSKESGKDLRERLYSEWYGANGSADGSQLPSDEVKDVTVFDFGYESKDGERKTVKVQFTKKAAAVEA